jgi:hypothetical protein
VSGRGANVTLFIAALVVARSAWAQSFTPDPGSWRPVGYTDLMFPVGEAEAYASIWQDRLDDSNRRLASKATNVGHSEMSLAVGNRSAREWHFAINFQSKLVVLSVLDTPIVCTDEYPSPSAAAKIRVCPMRLVTIEGERYTIRDGAACFLEKEPNGPTEDSSATATFAAYDIRSRTIKLPSVVSHQEIAQCAQAVSLHPGP